MMGIKAFRDSAARPAEKTGECESMTQEVTKSFDAYTSLTPIP